jgi:hypothetical protein
MIDSKIIVTGKLDVRKIGELGVVSWELGGGSWELGVVSWEL